MGSRSSAYCCQTFTNAISFIMFKLGICFLNYFDDFASAETQQNAEFSFKTMQAVLQKCGIEEAKNKACPPATSMIFIGVLFNTVTMTIEIFQRDYRKLSPFLQFGWNKSKASLKDIESCIRQT